MNKLAFILLTLLVTAIASASSGHGEGGVPVELVWHQTFNVVIMVGALVWFLRAPLKNHFKVRRAVFTEAAEKADLARKTAETEKSHMIAKLTKLESTAAESITRARAEAVDYKNELIREAHEVANRIKTDAEAAVKMELVKAKNEIRQEIINESIKATRAQLQSQVTTEDHDRLQSRFVDQLQVVGK